MIEQKINLDNATPKQLAEFLAIGEESPPSKRNLWNIDMVIGLPGQDVNLADGIELYLIGRKLGVEVEVNVFSKSADLGTRTSSKYKTLHLSALHVSSPQEFYSQLTKAGYAIRDSKMFPVKTEVNQGK